MNWYKAAQIDDEQLLDEQENELTQEVINDRANEEALSKLPANVVRKDLQQNPIRPPQTKQKLPGLIRQIFPGHEQQMDAQQATNAVPPASYRFIRDLVMEPGVGDKLRQIRQRQPPAPLELNPMAPTPTKPPVVPKTPTNVRHPSNPQVSRQRQVAFWLGGNCRFAQ